MAAGNPYEKPRLRAFAMVSAIALIGYGASSSFTSFSFGPEDGGDDPLAVFGRLALIALFLERAIEVLIELWRGSRKNRLKDLIELAEKKLALQKNTKPTETSTWKELITHREELREWQAVTIRISLWSGFLIGLIASISGIRVLAAIFSPEISGLQHTIFQGLDILLTGALISGGSEGIHQIASLYSTFIEESKRKLRENLPQAQD